MVTAYAATAKVDTTNQSWFIVFNLFIFAFMSGSVGV